MKTRRILKLFLLIKQSSQKRIVHEEGQLKCTKYGNLKQHISKKNVFA